MLADALTVIDLQFKFSILTTYHHTIEALYYFGCIVLDCRKSHSNGMSELRKLLKEICKIIRNSFKINQYIVGRPLKTKCLQALQHTHLVNSEIRSSSARCSAHVVLVGSHADVLTSWTTDL